MRAFGIAFVVLLVTIAAAAQAPSAPQAQAPVFRASADVVEVDVVVQDTQGRPVTDLSPGDFEVSEEGTAQRISVFYLVDGGVAHSALATRADGSAAATASPASPSAPRIFVVFFDDAHLTPGGFKRVQAAALTLFSKEFRNGDMGGIVHNGLMANSRLTSSREELLKAVRDAKPNSASNSRVFDERAWPRLTTAEAVLIVVNRDEMVLSEAVRRACADDSTLCQNADLAVRGKAAQLADEARASTNLTLQNLLALLNGLTRFEGRKTVLVLTEGFLAEESWPLVRESVATAARANARIYTLDARGLDRLGLADRLNGPSPGANDSMSRLIDQMDLGADSVNSLAVDTGGFVIRNTNLFDAAIAKIAADAGTYYVLGYRPDLAADGKYRTLSVKALRPGLVVRARKGYVATPRPSTTVATTAAMPRAAASATAPADIPETTPAAPPPAVIPPAASDAVVVPSTSSASGVRLRPNVGEHVSSLAPAPAAAPDKDASAGWDAYQRGDVATARTFLASAAPRANQPWVYYALGQSEYALRSYAAAVDAWERVRSGAADFEPVYFDLVDGYMQLKEYDKAVRLLRDASARWPRDPEVFNALGVVQTVRGSLDDAVKSFELAIGAAPDDAIGYFNLGKAMELRYYKSRHYVQQLKKWIANENDRRSSVENYERYLTLGGPYADAAREGLTRLNWTPK